MRTPLQTVVVVLLVVSLAGCAGPFGSDGATTPTQTPAIEETPTVEETPAAPAATPTDSEEHTPTEDNSELRFDPASYAGLGSDELEIDENKTYDRVTRLLGAEVSPPDLRVEGEGENDLRERLSDRFDFTEVSRLVRLNMTARSQGDGPSGQTRRNRVIVDPGNGSTAAIEAVLVHEFAHHVQIRDRWVSGSGPAGWEQTGPPRGTTEWRLGRRALVEGGAVYLTDQYAARYIETVAGDRYQSETALQSYTESQPGDTYVWAVYAMGARYMHASLDGPEELRTVYREDPPNTTYEMLFPEASASGAVTGPSLSVDTQGTDWRGQVDDRLGALFLHSIITATHTAETADEVVRGYRGDQMVELLGQDGENPFLWAVSFEGEQAADRFITTFEEGLDRRTDPYAAEFGLHSLDDGTVLVVAGPDTLRQNTTVTSTGEDIQVVIGENATTAQSLPTAASQRESQSRAGSGVRSGA